MKKRISQSPKLLPLLAVVAFIVLIVLFSLLDSQFYYLDSYINRNPQLDPVQDTLIDVEGLAGKAAALIGQLGGSAGSAQLELVAGATRYAPLTGERLAAMIQTRLDERAHRYAFNPAELAGSGIPGIEAWAEINPDVKAWLRIPGTNINYPVTIGPNNNYYMSLGYYKEYNVNSTIWADSDVTFGTSSQISNNTVLYGHNWDNISANPRITSAWDVMFEQLPSFHHLTFAQRTPYLYYSTASEEMVFKVFAVFYTEVYFNYIDTNSSNAYIISEAQKRSLHNYAVDVSASDKLLTLSTCTRAYGNRSDQRFVVMARLLRPGESVNDTVNITENPTPKQPQF